MKKIALILILLSAANTWVIGQSKIKEDSIVVNVKASFIITGNGEVTKVKIVESDCKHCDKETLKKVEQEVIRVIKLKSKLRSPNDNSGRTGDQKYILPLKVILRDN